MRSTFTAILLLTSLSGSLQSNAQLWPAEHATLNYRLSPFSCEYKGKGTYTFIVTPGAIYNEKVFTATIGIKAEANTSHTIIELPKWGREYTWQVTYQPRKGKPEVSGLFHFSTMSERVTDTAACRLRVEENKGKFDGYIFLDRSYTLHNAAGQAIWFLPPIEGQAGQAPNVRDLKITDAGTITFLLNDWPYETDYNGHILWKGVHEGVASGDTAEHYHHELTRLSNGNYMVLGNQMLHWRKEPLPAHVENEREMRSYEEKIPFGTVIEYDKWGNTKWFWHSSKYYYDTPMLYQQPINRLTDIHQNSFYFDEVGKDIYISFKNISQVVKIGYPDGKVQSVAGSRTFSPPGKGAGDFNMFCHQHSVRATRDGNVYLFNNNICNRGMAPSILMFRMPHSAGDTVEKLWEYTCPVDVAPPPAERRPIGTNGGNVVERPDGSFFASVCAPYAKVFIVNRNKELLYSAVPEGRVPGSVIWEPTPQFRASIINTRTELEKLVYSALPDVLAKH